MGKKGKSENVQVAVRVRPFNEREKREEGKECVKMDFGSNTVTVFEEGRGEEGRSFAFDAVYNNSFTQKAIYLQSIHPLVEAVLNGYNSTVFVYGQSGSGKTWSMTGDITNPERYGVVPNSLCHIFEHIKDNTSDAVEFTVQISFVELYLGNCRDLLTSEHRNLELRENSNKDFYVKDLTHHVITDIAGAMKLMDEGTARREVKSTKLNADSSRSHSVFTVYIRRHDKQADTRTEAQLLLVDLAGSERQSKTEAEGTALKEGAAINKSLTALGTVIDCLVNQKPHIPYRSDHLCMLLKPGLGGNSRTVIIGTISPSTTNLSETVSSLRFVDRAKQIKNKPKIQMDPKDAKIHELQEELKSLKQRFGLLNEDGEDVDGGGDDDGAGGADGERKEKYNKSYESQIEELKSRVELLEVEVMESKEEKERSYEELKLMEHKLEKERGEFQQKLQEAKEKQQEILDTQELDRAVGGGSISEQYDDLRKMCTNFFATIDPEGSIVPTTTRGGDKNNKNNDESSSFPSSETIANAFHLLETNLVLNSSPSANNLSASPSSNLSSPKSNNKNNLNQSTSGDPPSLARVRSFAGKSLNNVVVSQQNTDSSSNVLNNNNNNNKRRLSSVVPSTPSNDKEKDTLSKNMKQAELDESVLQDFAKKISEITSSSGEKKKDDGGSSSESKLKELLDDLLMKQRINMHRAMFDVLKKDTSSSSTSSEDNNNNQLDDVEKTVLAAYDHANDEIERLTDSVVKQKQLTAKAKQIADKRADEVASIKKQLAQVKEEMAAKHMQHASELEMVQNNIISQNNKKMEKLMAKHTKDLQKEKKQRDGLQKLIDDAERARDEALEKYDILVMEHETMMNSFEQSKFEQMRMVARSGGKGGGMIDTAPASLNNNNNNMPIPSNYTQTQQQKQLDRLREDLSRATNNNPNHSFGSTANNHNNLSHGSLVTTPGGHSGTSANSRSPRPPGGNGLPPLQGGPSSSSATPRGFPNSLPPLTGPHTGR